MTEPKPDELQALAKGRITPDELLERVSQKPIVNTFREQSELPLEMVNLIPATGKEQNFRYFRSGDHAIYWKASENETGVEIVGVVWDKDQMPSVICGVILPP